MRVVSQVSLLIHSHGEKDDRCGMQPGKGNLGHKMVQRAILVVEG